MDVLKLDGKSYVKSSVIARELGYTSDYVGQLCRAGKVDAKLFGRTWYVHKDSLTGHKRTRYRSSKAITKRMLTTRFSVDENSAVLVHTNLPNAVSPQSATTAHTRFYGKGRVTNRIAYDTDKSDLIPKPTKRLAISLAEATPLKVITNNEHLAFETPKLEEIRFRGKLHLSEVDEISEHAGETLAHTPVIHHGALRSKIAVHTNLQNADNSFKNIVISSVLPKNARSIAAHIQSNDVASLKAQGEVKRPMTLSLWSIFFSLLAGILVSLALFFVGIMNVFEGQSSTSYFFIDLHFFIEATSYFRSILGK